MNSPCLPVSIFNPPHVFHKTALVITMALALQMTVSAEVRMLTGDSNNVASGTGTGRTMTGGNMTERCYGYS